MSSLPPVMASDQECLEAFQRRREASTLRPVVERYFAFVHASALRRTNDAARAADVTRAVFLVFTRRARRRRKHTVLAGWLWGVTSVACRRAGVKSRRGWFGFLRRRAEFPPESTVWQRISCLRVRDRSGGNGLGAG